MLLNCPSTTAPLPSSCFFFFNDTATTEIYTLPLHDALPICDGQPPARPFGEGRAGADGGALAAAGRRRDRKSTRLNSSHGYISYAVFCLKKKKNEPRLRPGSHGSLSMQDEGVESARQRLRAP